ncbi:hypothetical protein DDD_2406 [Nonlabens dokdonensis DSW-6]|uniref:Uncharacterized protein n=1 Tax=Nonlabens dokdonensis (strain DSM 17205 / KCTC 12402 / DSW-6) TaxID=592029 RepID=L7WF58_NONDD|nr:hypothetical protein DDD_2406 [Nonlabens dokdonensis DSW-6]
MLEKCELFRFRESGNKKVLLELKVNGVKTIPLHPLNL